MSHLDHVPDLGIASGIATLDVSGFVPVSELGNVDTQLAYDNSAASPTAQVALDTTRDAFHIDGAALAAGGAGTAGPDYMQITRGAVNILNSAYNATDLRATVYSSAINGLDISPDPGILPDRATISVAADSLIFLRQDRTITLLNNPGFFRWTSTLTKAGGTFGGFVGINGTFEFSSDASGFGMGNAVLHGATWKNVNGVAANLGPAFLFANNAIYQADAATITISQARILFDNTTYNTINGGVLSTLGVGHVSFYSSLSVNSGATVGLRRGYAFFDRVGTGSVTTQIALDVADLTNATTNIGIRSAMSTGNFIEHTGGAASTFSGPIQMDNNVAISLGTAGGNRVTLLRSSAGVMRMIGIGGTNNEGLDWDFDGAADVVSVTSSTAARLNLNLDVTVGGAAGNVGFYGTTPIAQSAAYTPSNVTTDRSYDANSTTVDELADVLATVIADLQAVGLLG